MRDMSASKYDIKHFYDYCKYSKDPFEAYPENNIHSLKPENYIHSTKLLFKNNFMIL